jgi:hypothetical protein
MLEAPKVRVNLFAEAVDERKDWWGYLNIKESDLEQWVLLLADPKNVSTSQNGEREFVIPVIGFNVEKGTPEKGIRIMEKQLPAKARNSTVNRPQRKWG